jgi:hypothetical protein
MLHNCMDPLDVRKKIDKAMDELLFATTENQNTFHPITCLSCHSYVKRKNRDKIKKNTLEKVAHLLKPRRELHPDILNFYKYKGNGHEQWMNDLLLSPQSCFNNSNQTFILCKMCSSSLCSGILPKYAIANSFEFGEAPPELKCLTDIELAFLSPVRVHGHLFTYFGGIKGIKGWHSFLEVDMVNLNRNMNAINELPIPNNIAVVLTGPYTPEQKQRVVKKTTLRRDKVREAMTWLINNNTQWSSLFRDVDLATIPNPVIIDKR